MPVVFMSASRLSGRALVSPVTIPGIRPAGSGANHADAATNCPFTSEVSCRTSASAAVTTGAEDADRMAACVCPWRTAFSVPEVRTDSPGRTFFQSSPPTTRMLAEPRVTEPFVVTPMRSAVTDQRLPPERPGTGTSSGFAVMCSWIRTPLRSSTASASGPPSLVLAVTEQPTAAAAPRTHAKARVAEIVLARRPPPWRCPTPP